MEQTRILELIIYNTDGDLIFREDVEPEDIADVSAGQDETTEITIDAFHLFRRIGEDPERFVQSNRQWRLMVNDERDFVEDIINIDYDRDMNMVGIEVKFTIDKFCGWILAGDSESASTSDDEPRLTEVSFEQMMTEA